MTALVTQITWSWSAWFLIDIRAPPCLDYPTSAIEFAEGGDRLLRPAQSLWLLLPSKLRVPGSRAMPFQRDTPL